MQFNPLVSKARKPKFHLHLKIYDLNNVPLVSGVSVVKWHLLHTIHSEQRGRTQKCPVTNHQVGYDYAKIVPLRIVIDRTGSLSECPIEFEVTQEFGNDGAGVGGVGGRDERVVLGTIRVNLSEYVEESEALLRPAARAMRPSLSELPDKPGGHSRQRSSLSGISSLTSNISSDVATRPSSSRAVDGDDISGPPSSSKVEDGVVRRYLMQDSKINSTLKIGILMVQVDGDRNFVAPPLKSAPVFGGIAGLLPAVPLEPTAEFAGGDVAGLAAGPGAAVLPFNKFRDIHDMQDMYRRTLAASWASSPDELPADECIEDIFTGGDGFKTGTPASSDPASLGSLGTFGAPAGSTTPSSRSATDLRHRDGPARYDAGVSTPAADEHADGMSTLRPRDMAKIRHHVRSHSGPSGRTAATAFPMFKDPPASSAGDAGGGEGTAGLGVYGAVDARHPQARPHPGRRDIANDDGLGQPRDGSGSFVALDATGEDGDRGRNGFKWLKEVGEEDVREDLVAWSVSGAVVC